MLGVVLRMVGVRVAVAVAVAVLLRTARGEGGGEDEQDEGWAGHGGLSVVTGPSISIAAPSVWRCGAPGAAATMPSAFSYSFCRQGF